MSYSKLSQELTNNISKIEKEKDGIYFTPPDTIIRNLKLLSKHMKHIDTILEPSWVRRVYINYIIDKFNDKNITAIESNEKISIL